jgi:hypothetical protein
MLPIAMSSSATAVRRSPTATLPQRCRVVIYEYVCGQSSYVCELVHYAREPQLHVALPPRARQQRDGAQLDGDDARRHGGERRLSDDAPAPDASVLVPSEVLPLFGD